MQNFGFETGKYYLQLFKALEEDEHEHHGDTLQSVMEDIQDLLDASYFLGINPLKGLRKILPQYQWRYYRLENGERHDGYVKEVVSKSDFIWRIWYNDDDIQLVTATKLDRTPPGNLKYFWVEGVSKASQIAFAENFGGEPVYWG